MKAIYIYIDDWISSTDIDGMSAAQERGFFRFLLHQSKSDSGKLVKNDRQLGTKTRLGTRGWRDFLSEYSYLFVQDKGLIWNEKQYQGWLRQSRKSEQARDAARIRHAKPNAPALADAHAPAPAVRSARLKDLETSISQEKERSLSLSLPEGTSDAKPAQGEAVAKKGGDADEPSGTRGSKNVIGGGSQPTGDIARGMTVDTSSQADAGPPLCVICHEPVELRDAAVYANGLFEKWPCHKSCAKRKDSHEPGQSSRGARGTRKADGSGAQKPSAEAAPTGENPPTDGAGGVETALTHLKVQPLAGSKVDKSSTEAQDAGSPVTTEMKPPTLKGGGTVPNPGKPGPAPTPTDFGAWYATYPRKVGRSDAEKAWGRLSKLKRQRILATWPDWRTEFESRASDYIPYPASFIRELAWEEPPPSRSEKTQTTAERLAEL